MSGPVPLVALAVVAAATFFAHAVRHPALDGGPILGSPRAAVHRAMAANGWTHEPARSAPKGASAMFGHEAAHVEIEVGFDQRGVAIAAHVRPYLDETSEAFMRRQYGGLVAYLAGSRPHRLRKHMADGELQGLDVDLATPASPGRSGPGRQAAE